MPASKPAAGVGGATSASRDTSLDASDSVRLALLATADGHSPTSVDKQDRERAVRRMLRAHPEWADRRIGHLCGTSPKTVARIRSRLRGTFGADAIGWVDVRIGRDGRVRPLDAAAKRDKIAEVLAERPDASLRSIAKMVGVSPETVRTVRLSLEQMRDDAQDLACLDLDRVPLPTARRAEWRPDRSFTSREDSAATARFLQRTDVTESELTAHVAAVPLSRIYEVADEARRRAAFWERLAHHVEARAKSGRS
jgi:hypothetical protein